MSDITSPRLLYAKGVLFVVLGLTATTLILLKNPSLQVGLLLAIAIWSFARAYYFAFYVVEHYIDPDYRYAGLLSFFKHWIGSRRERGPR